MLEKLSTPQKSIKELEKNKANIAKKKGDYYV